MLFSLRIVFLLHKWEVKNIEVEFLKVSETVWSPGLPDIGARKSWDFLILTVSASTEFPNKTTILVKIISNLHVIFHIKKHDTFNIKAHIQRKFKIA